MPSISFFRQLRRDGGIRTGVDVDGDTVLSQFEAGQRIDEPDPSLEWYVDVRCDGARLPHTPEAARQWLLRAEAPIRNALEAMAASVPAGIDQGPWPIKHKFRIGSGAARGEVVCSAVRRVSAQNVADVLRNVAKHWRAYVSGPRALQYH